MLAWTRKAQESVVVGGSGAVPPMLARTILGIDRGSSHAE
jgi:hypothetical protein